MTLTIGRSLPRLRKLLNQTLPDSAHNARTNATVPVRVDSTGRTRTVPGLPNFVEIPLWDLTFRDFTDVAAGDLLTVTRAEDGGVSVYTPTTVWDHDSYSVSVDAEGIEVSLGSHGNLPMPPNALVTLTQQRTGLSFQADAYVFPLDTAMQATTQDFRLQAVVGHGAVYSDGSPLRANDHITDPANLGTLPSGAPIQGVISKPIRTVGTMPILTFYFREGP